jgi:excisionase family DNA binding protein
MTIVEAAAYARCKRQRIDDLLSMRRLTRHKDGRRTLIRRAELDAYLNRNQPRKGPPN